MKVLYPHPFPEFELDNRKWLGVSFGAKAPKKGGHLVPLVGLVLDDHEYARNIYELVLQWTLGEHRDEAKCIRVAVVEVSDSSYIFYCHPNFDHPSALEFYEQVDQEHRSDGVSPEREATMLFLGKKCDIGPGSRYRWFLERYRPGVPIMLEFCVPDAEGQLSLAKGVAPIVVFDVLFAKRSELDPDDPVTQLIELGPFDVGQPQDPIN